MQLTDFIAAVPVSKSGYRWEHNFEAYAREVKRGGTGADGLVLAGQVLGQVGGDHRVYDPFTQEKALWRDFAKLEPTEAAILAFANRYGVLRSDDTTNLSDWRDAMARWAFAFSLWEAIEAYKRSRRSAAINQYVRWEKNTLHWQAPPWSQKTKWLTLPASDAQQFNHGDLLAPAQSLLVSLFRLHMYRQLPGQPVATPNATLDVWPDPARTMAFKIVVPNLIDVLWIQFAVAVANEKQFLSCEVCGRAFELDDNRVDRRFCDNACRMKAYRDRKKKAIEMHRRGKSIKDICSALDSDMKTIRGWLKPKEKK